MVWARAADDELLVPLLEEGLAALSDDDDAELRVRLLARLSGVLRDDPLPDRRDALSGEAVELARRAVGPAALAYALVGRAHAIIAPDTLDECLALGNELLDLAVRSGDREVLMSAHMLRTLVLCMAGAVPQATLELADVRPAADELRQPLQVWWVCAGQAMLALATGQLAEAELLIAEALEAGKRALPGAAIAQYWLQRYTLCDFRSGLEEIEPEIRRVAARYPARPVFQCAFAHVQARLGRQAEAKGALAELARGDFSCVPFDQEWLYAMSLLAETAVLVGDADSAAVLHRLLVPWRTLNAVDVSEGFRGAVTRYLGMLDTMLGRLDDAQLQFEAALAMNERMGARPWVAHTQMDYAQMLVARDHPGDHELARQMLGAARATYRELGMARYAPAGSLTRPRITL
jgi:tetratricopeptide (TPR) repeat protein